MTSDETVYRMTPDDIEVENEIRTLMRKYQLCFTLTQDGAEFYGELGRCSVSDRDDISEYRDALRHWLRQVTPDRGMDA